MHTTDAHAPRHTAATTDRNAVAQRLIAMHGGDLAAAIEGATRAAAGAQTPAFAAMWTDVATLLRLETQSDEPAA
jgi:hypothetical protein